MHLVVFALFCPLSADRQCIFLILFSNIILWSLLQQFDRKLLLKASQNFAVVITTLTQLAEPEELYVRLAHRLKELDELPQNLSNVLSINITKTQSRNSSRFPLPTFN